MALALPPASSHYPTRAACITLVVATFLGAGIRVHADDFKRVRLQYEVEAGIDGCPSEGEFRSAVSTRLGYDPYDPAASRSVTVIIKAHAGGLKGKVDVATQGQDKHAVRELTAKRTACGELATTLAVVASLAIDPLSGSRPSPSASAPPSGSATLPPPPTVIVVAPHPPGSQQPPAPVAPVPPPPAPPIHFQVGLGAVLGWGSSPATAFGVRAAGGIRAANASLGLEGRADLDASDTSSGRGVETRLYLASVVPCFHSSYLMLCGLASAGAIQASGVGVDLPKQGSKFFSAAGMRAGAQFPLTSMFWLQAHGDIQGILTRVTVQLDGQDQWTTPSVASALGVGVGGTF